MNVLIFLYSISLISCSTNLNQIDRQKLSSMWKRTLTKDEIKSIYGKDFRAIDQGISYPRTKSSWPMFAFFFDGQRKLINQFALLDQKELVAFKEELVCSWRESLKKVSTPHVTEDVPIGFCEEYSVTYEFRRDIGLYEIRRMK